MDNLTPIFVSVNEAKRLLSLGHTRIYALMKSGEIEHVKHGAKTLIPYESLTKYAARLSGIEVANDNSNPPSDEGRG